MRFRDRNEGGRRLAGARRPGAEPPALFDRVVQAENRELDRHLEHYRGECLLPELEERDVVRATAERLRRVAGEVVCAEEPARFFAAGRFCGRFGQAGGDEVLHLLVDGSARAEVGT